jgi:hypothetical protein
MMTDVIAPLNESSSVTLSAREREGDGAALSVALIASDPNARPDFERDPRRIHGQSSSTHRAIPWNLYELSDRRGAVSQNIIYTLIRKVLPEARHS